MKILALIYMLYIGIFQLPFFHHDPKDMDKLNAEMTLNSLDESVGFLTKIKRNYQLLWQNADREKTMIRAVIWVLFWLSLITLSF